VLDGFLLMAFYPEVEKDAFAKCILCTVYVIYQFAFLVRREGRLPCFAVLPRLCFSFWCVADAPYYYYYCFAVLGGASRTHPTSTIARVFAKLLSMRQRRL